MEIGCPCGRPLSKSIQILGTSMCSVERDMKKIKKGFTLVELLVVIAIIALLLSIMMPALSGAKQQGWKIACAAKLRSIGLSAQMYANDNSKYFPYAYYYSKTDKNAAGGWCFPGAWTAKYYTGLERYTVRDGFASAGWQKIAQKYFNCPSRVYRGLPCYGFEVFSYGMNVNLGMNLPGWNRPMKRVLDAKRPSTMIMHVDVEGDGTTGGAVFYLLDNLWDTIAYRHAKSANILFLDGHVAGSKKVSSSIGDWQF